MSAVSIWDAWLTIAYRTLRVHDEHHGEAFTYSYSVWCTGERELYDLEKDPHQINNLLAPLNSVGRFASLSHHSLPKHTSKLLDRLDGLLLVLKTCVGEVCHKPYKALFPDIEATGGEVYSLSQALDERFDDYFKGLPKVEYSKCELGYQSRLEKPDWEDRLAYQGKRGHGHGHGLGGFVLQL